MLPASLPPVLPHLLMYRHVEEALSLNDHAAVMSDRLRAQLASWAGCWQDAGACSGPLAKEVVALLTALVFSLIVRPSRTPESKT